VIDDLILAPFVLAATCHYRASGALPDCRCTCVRATSNSTTWSRPGSAAHRTRCGTSGPSRTHGLAQGSVAKQTPAVSAVASGRERGGGEAAGVIV